MTNYQLLRLSSAIRISDFHSWIFTSNSYDTTFCLLIQLKSFDINLPYFLCMFLFTNFNWLKYVTSQVWFKFWNLIFSPKIEKKSLGSRFYGLIILYACMPKYANIHAHDAVHSYLLSFYSFVHSSSQAKVSSLHKWFYFTFVCVRIWKQVSHRIFTRYGLNNRWGGILIRYSIYR